MEVTELKSKGIVAQIKEAIGLAQQRGAQVRFLTGDTVFSVTVAADSNDDLIHRDYLRAQEGCISEVGPYPKPALSPIDLANDTCSRAERAVMQAQSNLLIETQHLHSAYRARRALEVV